MQGLMMDMPLLISELIRHADRHHGATEIVSRTVEGGIHRYNYREAHARARRLANALRRLGVGMHERVATLAWNGYRHFEIYYAAAGSGAVIHTINPRLFPDQIAWIINHAEDRVLMTDLTFLPLLEKLADKLPAIERYIVLTDAAHMPETSLRNAMCYETLIAAGIDVLLDDRDERPGVKFKDADLIGFPLRIAVGAKSLANGQIEWSFRRDRAKQLGDPQSVVQRVIEEVKKARTPGS